MCQGRQDQGAGVEVGAEEDEEGGQTGQGVEKGNFQVVQALQATARTRLYFCGMETAGRILGKQYDALTYHINHLIYNLVRYPARCVVLPLFCR